jgi:putative membrane protein
MPYYHDYGWNWIGALIMGVTMLIVLGGLITVLAVLLRNARHLGAQRHDAEHILEERYARGEIDDEELANRRATLRR